MSYGTRRDPDGYAYQITYWDLLKRRVRIKTWVDTHDAIDMQVMGCCEAVSSEETQAEIEEALK